MAVDADHGREFGRIAAHGRERSQPAERREIVAQPREARRRFGDEARTEVRGMLAFQPRDEPAELLEVRWRQRQSMREVVDAREGVGIGDIHGQEGHLAHAELVRQRHEARQLPVVGPLQRDAQTHRRAGRRRSADTLADLVEGIEAADRGVGFRTGAVQRHGDRFEQRRRAARVFRQ